MINDLKRTLHFLKSHPFASKYLLISITKWIDWQIKSRLKPNGTIVPFIGDAILFAKKGMTGATGNIYAGLHEFNDMGFLLHFLGEEDLFVDIGANIGSYSVLAGKVCKSKVIAIEPIFSTFQSLKKNVEINNIQREVRLINAACAAKEGEINFTFDQDTTNHVVNEKNLKHKTVSVKAVKLDHVLNEIPVLLKIDVEGFETEVLKGANNLLLNMSLRAIIIELNGSGRRYGYNENKIHEKLLNRGFKPCKYDPFTRTLEKRKNFGVTNTIYIRSFDEVQKKLISSKPFLLWGKLI